jgi:hypothetical protein
MIVARLSLLARPASDRGELENVNEDRACHHLWFVALRDE